MCKQIKSSSFDLASCLLVTISVPSWPFEACYKIKIVFDFIILLSKSKKMELMQKGFLLDKATACAIL